jgi:prevent-host-death family protein
MDITAADFKARCLKLMDEVAATGQPITITKRGKVVARLVPPEPDAEPPSLFGCMRGTAVIVGDIVDVPGPAWEADQALSPQNDPWDLSGPTVLLAAQPPAGA